MQTTHHDSFQDIREAVRDLCQQFSGEYFRKIDEARDYPEEFVDALTKAGWLAALIPQDFGGSGLGLTEASVIMEEINRAGGNSGACHGQMYNMGTLLRHGSAEQKRKYLPKGICRRSRAARRPRRDQQSEGADLIRGRSDPRADIMRPLDGIKVITLEHAIAAPFCTCIRTS
ncbi:acyl-CoA dehydrogenase domain protein [Burkholderia sp. H160]|nr:acyl-CoA dehydrogenase domain protein [Burkholderia sp. H160]